MPESKLTAVVGINWGDEGKGRMVDLLSADSDVVVRYQGGNNAGHTVVNDRGTFILNLLPSGILREAVTNVMGPGMVIDIEHLTKEVQRLRDAGIAITPENLRISNRAVIVMPYHVRQDILEEERLADRKFGSTRRGIGPVYGDKYMKKVLRMGDLLYPNSLKEKVEELAEWKNLILHGGYNDDATDANALLDWLAEYGKPLVPYICDTGVYLTQALEEGKSVLLEAQLGALRDVDYGIVPYTSSSPTVAAYGPIGAGIPGRKLDNVLGVMKAYSTCVGEGPFTAELFGDEAEKLREAGGEYGAATGRPRRVGPFDVVASRYGARMQGANGIALTKLDVLSDLDEIPVCVAYEIDGHRTEDFPMGVALERAKPVYERLPGWKQDIHAVRDWEDLPEKAKEYVRWIEQMVGVPISFVSVGPEREAYLRVPLKEAIA